MQSEKITFKPIELWAFLENSDFQRNHRGDIRRWDEVRLTRHDERLDQDYQLLADIGMIGVRDAARWYVTHPAPGQFDWTWLDRVVAAADKYKLVLYLDLWHYGYPEWLDLMAPDAPHHFAEFACQTARRYPKLQHWCVANEPTVLIDWGSRVGQWRPFLRGSENQNLLRLQICRYIIAASKAILEEKPDALLILPEPWHAWKTRPRLTYDHQALVLDTVMGKLHPELGGSDELVTIIGLNHYLDDSVPPFHILLEETKQRWPNKPLWLTETSGPPHRYKQVEWFWWILEELLIAQMNGVDVPVLTWAPAFSMFDWINDTKQLHHGIWKLDDQHNRVPNGFMLEAIQMARARGYLK